MKRFLTPATALAAVFVLVLFAPAAFSQVPKSGALLTIDGTANSTPVNLNIYDSQIHTGTVQIVPIINNCGAGDQIPTDAYVLQGGSPTGCDPGDSFETTQGTGAATLGNFTITTNYPLDSSDTAQCESAGNTGSICIGGGNVSVDTGFLTVTNNGADFSGTITLSGQSPLSGGPWCAAGGNSSDSFTGVLSGGTSRTFALSPDSSNCGGFNQPQLLSLTQLQTSTANFGKDDYQLTPLNSVNGPNGDTVLVLPVPTPAGPLGSGTFGPFPTGCALNCTFQSGEFGSETPTFTSPLLFSATNYPNLACLAYADFSAPGNPVCVELQVTPSGPSGGHYFFTVQTDQNIDKNSLPNGIGGPALLGQHLVPCPATGFDINIITAFQAPSVTFGDYTRGSDSGTGSCWVVAFDPNATAVTTGSTVSTFTGFAGLFPSPRFNLVSPGSAEPLIFTYSTTSSPITNLHWCKSAGVDNIGSTCGAGASRPWVSFATLPVNCSTGLVATGVTPTDVSGSSNLQNFGGGKYQFNWKTSKTGTLGTCVAIVAAFDTGLVEFPDYFKYAKQ